MANKNNLQSAENDGLKKEKKSTIRKSFISGLLVILPVWLTIFIILILFRLFGKNAILRGLNFEEGATAKDRNKQIGGHKA